MRGAVKYILLLWISILSASCIFDAERCVISTDGQYDVMFTVSLDGHSTRASWNEEYPSEEGVPFDYRIMPNNLHVVVFTAAGERLGMVSDLYYWPTNELHTEFKFIGLLPREFVEHAVANNSAEKNYRFMVLANCEDNATNVEEITYSQAQLDPKSEESAIPMWGVKEVDVTPLYNDGNLDIGEISLLRAAAKVVVKLNDELKDDTTINSATLKYYNQTGYVLPTGWADVKHTKDLDYEECIRLYRHAAVNMPLVKDETTGDYYLYITEYDNIHYIGERNKISLEFNVGGKAKYFEDAISFCQYSDGEPVDGSHYNIVRNHIYQFEIRSIAGSNLVLEYTVANWTSEDWDGNGAEYEEHELSYPTYHNPVVPYEFLTSTQQASYVITQQPTMHYSAGNPEAGGFHCYFQILAPEDVEWKPVFMGSKENYQIRVYRLDKNLVQSGTAIFDSDPKVQGGQGNIGACGAGEWYHIVVFPLSDDGADKTTIEFGISYYQAWTDQYINLYVNGEYDNIRWPNSGNNPKIINIRHTSAKQTAEEE